MTSFNGSNRTAVLICARNLAGRILLVNTHGIEIKKATQAAKEAFEQLGNSAGSDDMGDIASTNQGLPLSCGSVRLWHGRWRVFYRALGPTMVLVLAPGCQNAFSSLNLLAQVVRIVTVDGKVPEVPIERVQRKYSEVYLAVDAIVSSGGVLTASEALSEAHAVQESLQAPPGQLIPRKLARHPVPPVSYKVEKRSLASQVDQLVRLSFNSSGTMAGLRALPGWELEQRQQQEEEKAPVEDPFAEAEKKDGKDPWEDMFGPLEDATIKPAEAAKPPLASSALPSRPLLRLNETWRAEFEGAKALSCGLDGSVQWADDVANDPPSHVRFSLSCAVWADQQVRECLRSAQRHGLATSAAADGTGGLVADGNSSRMMPPPILLRYHLPQGPGIPAPLLVNLGASTQRTRDGHDTAVLVGLRIAVSQQSHLALQCLRVTLTLPALFRQPARVSPPGALFAPERRMLYWSMPGEALSPGGLEVLAAVFRVRAPEAACTEAIQELLAEVELLGQHGGGYSGVALNQAFEQSTTRADTTAKWQAQVVARPAPR